MFGRWTIVAIAAALAIVTPAAAQDTRADRLNGQAKTAMMARPDQALALATQAERSAGTIVDGTARATATATALWLQSEALIRTRDSKAAKPRIDKALRMIEQAGVSGKLRGDLLLARAGVEQSQMQPAQALASLQEAFKIFGAAGERRSQSLTLVSIATLYGQANDFVSADKYFKQASEIFQGDPQLQLFLFNNRGNVLLRMERDAEATAQYRRALEVGQKLGSAQLVPSILANLSRSLIAEGKLDEADQYIREGLSLARGGGSKSASARLLAIGAESAFRRGDLARARSLIERSFAGVDLATTPMAMRDAHITAYEIYSALKQGGKALPHLERVRNLGDDAAELATSTNTALMAARFDYANQELRIANLKAEELRRSAEFQRTIFIGLGSATAIIILLLSVGLFTIRRSRNQVREANTVLNETNVALEKALKAKTEFLATTSHEIRTPLNGILGMTQIMLRDATMSAAARDRLGIVHGAGMTMRALVDDILDVAKMETGNLTVELAPTDLHATMKDAARMWEEQARAKDVGFTLDLTDAPRWIETDAGRLRQVIFNLLSNAIKFTEQGSVDVRVAAAGERLSIAISDSGIGIPAHKHEEIFESFRQVDAGTTRKFGGTGLGLAIVRNLARALDGDVAVRSVEGEGTVFTVELPLRAIEPPQASADVPDNGETIVVLDRNPIARGMLRTLFAPKFRAVEFAAAPAEAIDLIGGEGPMLLLIDEMTLKAAGEDPLAVLRDLVAQARARDARTAVLWAKPDAAMMQALILTGIGQVVAKPVSGATLIDCLTMKMEENHKESGSSSLVSDAA